MPQSPPELRVEIRQVGEQYLAVTERANGKEIFTHTFTHDPAKLVYDEPGWMLEKGARAPAQTLRAETGAAERPSDAQRLATYGQRLYAYLFGNGTKLQNFFEFNDAYRRQARLTLCLHPGAAALWRLPWEYLHDGQDFLCLTGRLLLSRVPEGLGQLSPPETAPPAAYPRCHRRARRPGRAKRRARDRRHHRRAGRRPAPGPGAARSLGRRLAARAARLSQPRDLSRAALYGARQVRRGCEKRPIVL